MLPDSPFLQLVPARALRTAERIREAIWQDPVDLEVEWTGCGTEHLRWREASKRKRTPVRAPFFWGTPFDQAWFRIRIPSRVRGGDWFLEWKEQGESTAYIDGVPYAGLDIAHETCRIPDGCREIWMEVMCLETGIWMPGPPRRPSVTAEGCRFERACARRRNERAWSVYHDFEILLDLLRDEYGRQPGSRSPFGAAVGYATPLDNVSVLYRQLARHIENAINAYDRDGLDGAGRALRKAYRDLAGRDEGLRCRLTGHAHIDLVWLWTETASESKAVHTFATMNRLMEEYPEFRFGYSQPASYRAVERRAPELMKAVRRRIRQGRWEAVGAAEVESDTQIACGEGLVRSLLLGQEGFTDLQGHPSPVLWLPDVFGYAACLPQILAQTGVKYFFTTKLNWGSVTRFPYSSFTWKGPDGSTVLAHVSQGIGYNMTVLPSEIREGARQYRQADVHREFLVPSGIGDGGGGVTPEMCERARRLADLAGMPNTAWGRIDEFFAGLDAVQDRLPTYRGELYLQYHRGVLTTHGDLKERFRAAERALQAWEAAHCVAGRGPIDREPWRRLVFAQFHDYIPGSSVKEVYEEALPELEAIAGDGFGRAASVLRGRARKPAVFNPLPLARRVVIDGRLCLLPPLAVVPRDRLERIESAPVEASRKRLCNGRVEATFDAFGRIASLTVDGCRIPSRGPLADLEIYPDQPHAFDAWDIDRSTLALGQPIREKATLRIEEGDGGCALVVSRALTKSSRAEIRYRLRPGSPVLEITCELDWQDPGHLLKMLFPTGFDGEQARFGGPFGSVLRSQQPGQPYDEAQWEVAGSRYAVIGDDAGREGLFVATEAKYGWSCREGTLDLSLLRSAQLPQRNASGGASPGAGPVTYSDLGRHVIRLCVGRFSADAPREEMPAAIAELCFTSLIETAGGQRQCGFLGLTGGPSLIPCWAKPESASEWVLRLHETLGCHGTARLKLDRGWSATAETLSGGPMKGCVRGHTLRFTAYQVLSIRLRHNGEG